MSKITPIFKKQKPVTYTIYITSGYDGMVEAQFSDISEDTRSVEAIISDLEVTISLLKEKIEEKNHE